MAKRWTELEADPAAVHLLVERAGLTPLAAAVLVQRGYSDPDSVADFLSPKLSGLPTPEGMLGIPDAVEIIARAVEKKTPTCVYGDYDVDGVTATSLLVDFFTRIGHPVTHFVPVRGEGGYGFHESVVAKLAGEGVGLIITVDTGITGLEACEEARRAGIPVVITDHHELPETLPRADAIINPHLPGCLFRSEQLTGVGLAFFLAAALRAELEKRGAVKRKDLDLREMLDLVALGTIADMAPVTGVNRMLVSAGLPRIAAEARPGIAALKKVSGYAGKRLDCGGIAFGLVPRINAAGRLTTADVAVELLTTSDPEVAARHARFLDQENARRQSIEQEVLAVARKMIQSNPYLDQMSSLVLSGDDWHPGVIGIVAGRIVDEFYRPTIVVSFAGEVGKGSGRSIKGYDLHDALKTCSSSLLQFGGHKAAAGLTLRKDKLSEFMLAFEQHARRNLRPEDLQPTLDIAKVCALDELDERTACQIESMAPFGIGNPTPVFATRGARVIFKTILKGEHLKLRLAVGSRAISALGWFMASRFGEIGTHLDLAYQLSLNEYQGRREIQLTIKDF